MSIDDFFPKRPAATPTIYAFASTHPDHAGLLKVGYTERPREQAVAALRLCSARQRDAEIFADGESRRFFDLVVSREGRSAGVVGVAPVGMPAPFAQQSAAVVGEVAQKVAPFHAVTVTRSLVSAAASAAAARLSWSMSLRASWIESRSSARVRSWQLTPGISSTHPTHQSPSSWMMAV